MHVCIYLAASLAAAPGQPAIDTVTTPLPSRPRQLLQRKAVVGRYAMAPGLPV